MIRAAGEGRKEKRKTLQVVLALFVFPRCKYLLYPANIGWRCFVHSEMSLVESTVVSEFHADECSYIDGCT